MVTAEIKSQKVTITAGVVSCSDAALRSTVQALVDLYETEYHGYEIDPDTARMNYAISRLAPSQPPLEAVEHEAVIGRVY